MRKSTQVPRGPGQAPEPRTGHTGYGLVGFHSMNGKSAMNTRLPLWPRPVSFPGPVPPVGAERKRAVLWPCWEQQGASPGDGVRVSGSKQALKLSRPKSSQLEQRRGRQLKGQSTPSNLLLPSLAWCRSPGWQLVLARNSSLFTDNESTVDQPWP